MVYLDYAATSPLLPEVIKAMHEAEQKYFANASALHTPGHLAMNQIENARELLAQIINADPSEIIFTSSASESNNTIIRTFEGHEIVTSPLEHHSIVEAAKVLSGSKKPTLYSYMLANNEIGEFLPITDVVKKAHKEGSFVHSDLTQVLGKLPIDVRALDLDYAAFSAHKNSPCGHLEMVGLN